MNHSVCWLPPARILRVNAQAWCFCGVHSVEKFKTLEHLEARVTVVRWHLDAAAVGHGDSRRHLDSASLTYQGAVELLGQLAISAAQRSTVERQLADLRQQLRELGQNV